MSRPIRLDQIEWFPRSIRTDLGHHRSDFARAEFVDDIQMEPWFEQLATALEEVATRRDVVAFHACREAEPDEIASRGLRVLGGSGDSHRAEFLDRFGHLFSQGEREQIKHDFAQVWSDERSSRGRQNKLCFALAHPRHWRGGADDLLGIYGGEAIYSTWGRVGPIVDKLRTVGTPAVVHFRISVEAIRTWMRLPVAGRTALWAWHRRLRRDVWGYWTEGYMFECVPPEQIVKVERWSRPVPKPRFPRNQNKERTSEELLRIAASGGYDDLTDAELLRIIEERA